MTAGVESPCGASSRIGEPGLDDRLDVPGADNVKAARNRNEHICGNTKSVCYKLRGVNTTRGKSFAISTIVEGLVGGIFC